MKKGLSVKSGFTLIELLIVIAIVSIITSIIIQSLSSSRTKAYDSKVKQQLVRFRSGAELYFNNQTPNAYSSAGTISDCAAVGSMFTDNTEADGSPGAYLVFSDIPGGVTVKCGANALTYAVQATLPGGGFYCVDSTGVNKQYSGAIGSPSTACPP